jgi:hypothetical protein
MIPSVRALLSTSWDPEIRRALAAKRAAASAAAGHTTDLEHGANTVIGTVHDRTEAEEPGKAEGAAGVVEEGGASGDTGGGGGGGGDAAGGDAAGGG